MINTISLFSVPIMIVSIVAFGLFKRDNVYDSFVQGAKLGLESTVQISAPLVGLMVAISMFRASGALEILSKLLSPLTSLLEMPSEVLPLALLRPVSGSGSIAIVNDIFKNYGPDSIPGKIASVMMGSTETTFYTVALYYGAAKVKNIRHTLHAALLADFCGIIGSVIVCRLYFKI